MEYEKTKLPFVSGRKYNNLLRDYDEAVDKLETLLLEVTGKLSKSTYPLEVMLSESIRHTEELVDEAVEKTVEETVVDEVVEDNVVDEVVDDNVVEDNVIDDTVEDETIDEESYEE